LKDTIDRVLPFIVFEQKLNRDQLENLLVTYPKRVPEDFKAALIVRIQQIIRQYWSYCSTRKGYHKVLKGVVFLENVARYGFEGCQLVPVKSVGYQLELKPEHRKKK
jgi:hypothetical protein